MVQFEEKRGIGKKQLAQIVSVATTERFCAIAERVFCRKASATLGVEKQAGERVGVAVRPLLDSQRPATPVVSRDSGILGAKSR